MNRHFSDSKIKTKKGIHFDTQLFSFSLLASITNMKLRFISAVSFEIEIPIQNKLSLETLAIRNS